MAAPSISGMACHGIFVVHFGLHLHHHPSSSKRTALPFFSYYPPASGYNSSDAPILFLLSLTSMTNTSHQPRTVSSLSSFFFSLLAFRPPHSFSPRSGSRRRRQLSNSQIKSDHIITIRTHVVHALSIL